MMSFEIPHNNTFTVQQNQNQDYNLSKDDIELIEKLPDILKDYAKKLVDGINNNPDENSLRMKKEKIKREFQERKEKIFEETTKFYRSISGKSGDYENLISKSIQEKMEIIENIEKEELNKITSESEKSICKTQIFSELSGTYDLIMSALSDALSCGKDLLVSIQGKTIFTSNHPTVKDWLRANSVKASVIVIIMNELTSKGWHPYLTKDSDFTKDYTTYEGGRGLSLRCSFSY